jgi:hypothetical protein
MKTAYVLVCVGLLIGCGSACLMSGSGETGSPHAPPCGPPLPEDDEAELVLPPAPPEPLDELSFPPQPMRSPTQTRT